MHRISLPLIAVLLMLGCQDTQPQPPAVDIWLASAQGNLGAIRQHLAAGTDVNAQEPYNGGTPLMLAALTGQTSVAEMLIENGAELDMKNNDGATALLIAAFFGHPETLRLLIGKGADVNVRNNEGQTPLDTVAGPWSPELKGIYSAIADALKMEVDLERVKTMRPVVAEILREHGGKTADDLAGSA